VRTGAPREKGFTLLELIVIAAIIAVIAAIAIPRLLESRDTSYEETAHCYLRAVHHGETLYQTRKGRCGTLDELKAEGYIRLEDLSSYAVVITVSPDGSDYFATAAPLLRPAALRYFFMDATGVVRYAVGIPADSSSTPL
jgi:prepilin-type N-terminal cleavage/methylation domain-containing protein